MKKTLLITVSLLSISVTSVSFADETPFHYDYKIDGYVSGVTSIAVDPSYSKAVCHIAIDKQNLTSLTPNFIRYNYYHYSMTGEGCATAKLAYMTGESVYLWGTAHGGSKNPEAVAIEMVNGNVKWTVSPKER
ncbi:Uncharacterised protein [Proteus vulgaris]|uniref:hypothetical protein n=1 Tax=Proteus vulgaris TaxID=585 RepID=UPI000DFE98B7|nr:hypothetical protein [Proteus vulgaris]SUC00074.1 Uncharacterised protein [Proteus vulgaris]